GDPHRDADVGGLEGRGVVHAVTGHRDDAPGRLQRVDDPQFVLGRHTRVDGYVLHGRAQPLFVERLQLGARQRARARLDDAEVAGNACGSTRVVAGDHQHANTGLCGLVYGRSCFVARRVDASDEPEIDEL